MPEWWENEDFWKTTAPALFSAPRLESAATEVETAVKLLELEPEASILDLCCGPGRHSLEFSRRGLRVTGVDRNADYLRRARRRAKAEGLHVEFVREDMRRFSRPGAYDGAVNLWTSFGYFEDPEDDRRVARNLFDSLRPGGRLLMELRGKEALARIFRERDWHRCDDGTLLLEECRLLDDWSVVEGRWILVKDGQQKEFTHRIRFYSAVELKALLCEAGFASFHCFGTWDLKPYDHEAQRLLVLAGKPGSSESTGSG